MEMGHESNMGDGPISIKVAYDELSQEAFAVWIRLMVTTEEELRAGRGSVARLVGYSEGRSNEILRELKNKGYVEFNKGDHPGLPTEIIITRRPIVSGRNRFVKLSNFTHQSEFHTTQLSHQNSSQFAMPRDMDDEMVFGVFAHMPDSHSSVGILGDSPMPPPMLTNSSGGGGEKPTKVKPKFRQKWILPGPAGPEPGHESLSKSKPLGRKKFATSGGVLGPDSETSHGRKTGGLSISKLQEAHLKEKDKRRIKQGERRSLAKTKSIEWAKLDLRGDPVVTFEPSVAQRRDWISILKRNDRDGDKRKLLGKLGTEFSRVYTRYRRMWQETKGHIRDYDVSDDQQRYARRAARLCIITKITPRDLIEYWHANIKDFANSKLKVPPLAFLSSETNIQTVVCAIEDRKWKSGDAQRRMVPAHGFSDTASLDKRLRSGLASAGHNVNQRSDRDLMTIQKAAVAIAKGYKMFISDEMKPLVMWAVDNLYGGIK